MPLGYYLLAAAGCFALSISFYLYRQTERFKFQGLFWASGFFILVNVGHILQPVLEGSAASFIIAQAIEWGEVYSISFVLSALMLFIRRSKPEFSRFPLFYATMPFIIVLSYLLVYNTVVLKDWLLHIYQGGAAVVAILMYGIYNHQESVYRTVFIGAILFAITFFTYLLLPTGYAIIWQLLLFTSIGTVFSGYWLVHREFEEALN